MNVHEYAFQSLRGAPISLTRFKGQPILVVNTASECGFTPQYAKLQRMWNEYRESGLVVLGIPCDDFGGQEPGDDDAIDAFCHENYGVTFPMTSKQTILGDGAHPLFRDLQNEHGSDVLPKWNFYKYLFGGHGDLLECWPSKVEPDDPLLTHQIERNLSSWIL